MELKDGNKCNKEGSEVYNNNYYCKTHLKDIIQNF